MLQLTADQLEVVKEATAQFQEGIRLLSIGDDSGSSDFDFASFDLNDAGLPGRYVKECVLTYGEAELEDILEYIAEALEDAS